MTPRRRAAAGAAALALLLVPADPSPASAQEDSVTITAGRHYRAGATERRLWGSEYRDVWTTPVRVPVLDPDTFAGGLTPLRAGGDFASNTLHVRDARGRRWVFRSIDKDVSKGLGPELAETVVDDVVQDQVSASHPGAALVAAGLLEAAGVLHAEPRLAVMADVPTLGEHRELYGGMLGTIEIRPDEYEDDEAGTYLGADRIKSTENFLDDLEDDARDRVDAPAYLAARLMDLLMGDWDRHEDQWRWARYDQPDGTRLWRPIPRDRDNAFVHHDGWMLAAARRVMPRMVLFGEEYPSIYGLTVQAAPLDRRLLASLDRARWDSVAAALQRRLDDAAIRAAVDRLPAAWRARSGERLERTLRARRDALPEAAAEFYELLAGEVDVHTSDEDEAAVVERRPDGTLLVDVRAVEEDRPVFRRLFRPDETREVRIYLHGGDDRATVRGGSPARIGVRVIAGGGGDLLADSSTAGGVAFYAAEREDSVVAARGTKVDRRHYEAPVDSTTLEGHRTVRDWGALGVSFAPSAEWRSGVGPVLGFGPAGTRYGFRRHPNAWRVSGQVEWAPLHTRFGARAAGVLHPENSPVELSASVHATEAAAVQFHGFGNEAPETESDLARVWLRQLRARAAVEAPLGDLEWARLSLGPELLWIDPEPEEGSPFAALGPDTGAVRLQAGARLEAEIDRTDDPAFPRRGFHVEAAGTAWPAAFDLEGAYSDVEGDASAFVPLGPAVLAARLGGTRVWGDVPVDQLAFLGGSGSLRGWPSGRFAGDAEAHGGVELRVPLGRAKLGVRGTYGVLALADAGRVWLDGDSPGDWHTGVGGGVWFHALGQRVTVSYAHGEGDRLYVKLGEPFF